MMGSVPGPLVARFVLALSAEAVYLAGRTWLLHHTTPSVGQELLWTAWRLPFLAIYLWLFRGFAAAVVPRRGMPSHPVLFLALGLCLLDVLHVASQSPGYRITLALTSPVVGIREELLYHGIVQGFVERLAGPWIAIAVASVIFTAFHYGAQPMSIVSLTGIAATGTVLGAIYQRTGNLWLVAGLHAGIDVLYALCPSVMVDARLLVPCNVLAIACAFAWWARDRRLERGGR